MYIEFNARKSISVPEPYQRVLTTYLMPENAPVPLPFSVHLCEWEPGRQNDMHSHKTETEAMYVLSGHGIFIDNDKNRIPVGPDDVCLIECGQGHGFENDSEEELVMMALVYKE